MLDISICIIVYHHNINIQDMSEANEIMLSGRMYNYKLTVKKEYWSDQLQTIKKRLTPKDLKILKDAKHEKQDNETITRIYENAMMYDLYIPSLTELVGDCMFESIEKTGLCEDRNSFRQCVAFLFYLFGDCRVFTRYDPKQQIITESEETLKEFFGYQNEIEYVYCNINKKLYSYTYSTMCADMFEEGSWSRLPTQLVLMVISVFFKVRFHIHHDNGYVQTICDVILDITLPFDDPTCNIHLGLMGEYHYIPLIPIPLDLDRSNIKCPRYTAKTKKFIKWADSKADQIGLYTDYESGSDDNEVEIVINTVEDNIKIEQEHDDTNDIDTIVVDNIKIEQEHDDTNDIDIVVDVGVNEVVEVVEVVVVDEVIVVNEVSDTDDHSTTSSMSPTKPQIQDRISYTERIEILMFKRIDRMCIANKIIKKIGEYAKTMYKQTIDTLHETANRRVRGMTRLGVVAGCLWNACQIYGDHRTIEQIAQYFDITEKDVIDGNKIISSMSCMNDTKDRIIDENNDNDMTSEVSDDSIPEIEPVSTLKIVKKSNIIPFNDSVIVLDNGLLFFS